MTTAHNTDVRIENGIGSGDHVDHTGTKHMAWIVADLLYAEALRAFLYDAASKSRSEFTDCTFEIVDRERFNKVNVKYPEIVIIEHEKFADGLIAPMLEDDKSVKVIVLCNLRQAINLLMERPERISLLVANETNGLEFLDCIREVLSRDEPYLSRRVAMRISYKARELLRQQEGWLRLTKRQMEVLELMAQGYSNASIAKKLILGPKSVENYINAIYQALNVQDGTGKHPRVHAVLCYQKNNYGGIFIEI